MTDNDPYSALGDRHSAGPEVKGASVMPVLLALNTAVLILFMVHYVVTEGRRNASSLAASPVLVFDRGVFTDEAIELGIPAADLQRTYDELRSAAEDAGFVVLLNGDGTVLAVPDDRLLLISDFLDVGAGDAGLATGTPPASPDPS